VRKLPTIAKSNLMKGLEKQMSKLVRATFEMIPISAWLVTGLTVCVGLAVLTDVDATTSIFQVEQQQELLLAQTGQTGEGSRRPGTGLDR
jgi:hypothetical protein